MYVIGIDHGYGNARKTAEIRLNKGKRHSPCELCHILQKNCPLEYDSKAKLFLFGFKSVED